MGSKERKVPEKPKAGQEEKNSYLLKAFETVSEYLNKLTIGRRLEKQHPNRLDLYIIGWFTFQIILIICLAVIHFNDTAVLAICILLSYRLYEIGINTLDSVIVLPLIGKKHHSVPRMISLIFANYFQVIASFGIILHLVSGQESLIQSFVYSVSFSTLSGASLSSSDIFPQLAAIFEMLMGILFVAGAISAIANYLGNKE